MQAELSGRYLTSWFHLSIEGSADLLAELEAFLTPHLHRGSHEQSQTDHSQQIIVHAAGASDRYASRWQRDQGGSWVFDDPAKQCRRYAFDPEAPRVMAAQDIYCGLRRVALRNCASAVLLHAAAINLNEHTIILAGRKASGKSTALLCALEDTNARLVAGDKLVIYQQPSGQMKVTGLIESIRMSKDNLRFLKGSDASGSDLLTFAADRGNWHDERIQSGKLSIAPQAVQALLGRRIATDQAPTAVILLDQAAKLNTIVRQKELSQKGKSDLAERLEHILLTDSGVFEQGLPDASRCSRRIMSQLSEQCELVRLNGRHSREEISRTILEATGQPS